MTMATFLMRRRVTSAETHTLSFTEWTSTHGIPQISRSRGNLYCLAFWVIITLAALGVLIWQIVLIVKEYTQHGVSVSIDLEFQARPFPAVTICSLNPYKKSVVYGIGNVERLMDTYTYYVQSLACKNSETCNMVQNDTLEEYVTMYGFSDLTDGVAIQVHASRLLALEIGSNDVSDAVIQYSTFIQGCSFNTQDCVDADWTEFFDPVMGRCLMFNLNATYSSQRAGPIYGLRVILLDNVTDYIATSNTAGFRILVHDQKEFPFPDVFGSDIMIGTATSFGVTFTETSRLGQPYGDCVAETPTNYLYSLNYSVEGCQRTYYQEQIVSACNCYDPEFPAPKSTNVSMCTVANDVSCWDTASNETTSSSNCYEPCFEGDYAVSGSNAKWPAGSITIVGYCIPGTYNVSCIEHFTNNGAMAEVFYQQLNYQLMDENPSYTVSNMLSDLGGQIGLWLGMSIVSLIEFSVLIFQIVVTFLSPRFGNYFRF